MESSFNMTLTRWRCPDFWSRMKYSPGEESASFSRQSQDQSREQSPPSRLAQKPRKASDCDAAYSGLDSIVTRTAGGPVSYCLINAVIGHVGISRLSSLRPEPTPLSRADRSCPSSSVRRLHQESQPQSPLQHHRSRVAAFLFREHKYIFGYRVLAPKAWQLERRNSVLLVEPHHFGSQCLKLFRQNTFKRFLAYWNPVHCWTSPTRMLHERRRLVPD